MKTYSLTARPASLSLRAAAGLAAALALSTAFAQRPVREETKPVRDDVRVVRTPATEPVKLKNPDRHFVEKVTRGSMEEADVSRVAVERTANPRVKAFAEAMLADHDAMAKELAAIVADKGVAVPAKENFGERWLKHDAKSFDVDYLKKMVSDHEETLKLFQKQARDGHDPDLVAFARKHLPALQHHLQEASDLHKMMK